MELSKIISRAKQMQKTMNTDVVTVESTQSGAEFINPKKIDGLTPEQRKKFEAITGGQSADNIDNVALEQMLKEVVKCKDETQAQNFWSSIRAYCKTIPNSPFTVNRSNLPIEVQEVMATIKAEVIEASTTFFNTGNIQES